jgi:hypothetical protein
MFYNLAVLFVAQMYISEGRILLFDAIFTKHPMVYRAYRGYFFYY